MPNFRYQPRFAYKYKKETGGLDFYASQDSENTMKWCAEHPQKMIKPQFSVCYTCFTEGKK